MRQFSIIGWKGNTAFARSGKDWVKLSDTEARYDAVRQDFNKLTETGLHEDYDCIELFALAGPVKARRLITKAEHERRKKVIADQTKAKAEADAKKAEAKPTAPAVPAVKKHKPAPVVAT